MTHTHFKLSAKEVLAQEFLVFTQRNFQDSLGFFVSISLNYSLVSCDYFGGCHMTAKHWKAVRCRREQESLESSVNQIFETEM